MSKSNLWSACTKSSKKYKANKKRVIRPKKPQGGRNLKDSRFNSRNNMIGEEKICCI